MKKSAIKTFIVTLSHKKQPNYRTEEITIQARNKFTATLLSRFILNTKDYKIQAITNTQGGM